MLRDDPSAAGGVFGPVTAPLAAFLALSRWEDLPEAVRHEAKRMILNFFGAALGGCRNEATELALRVLSPLSAGTPATIIGRAEKADSLTAAFINAVSGNALDFDDTHHRTIIHPSAPVAPALCAVAESRPLKGADLLHAFVLGLEVECRLGNAVSPAHYQRGWHITATCGVFGAAAGSAKCLGLDARNIAWALGNASAQSAGLVETLGSMAKSLGVGNAARGGALAALLAEVGFTGPAEPLAGPRGFANVMGEKPDPAAITAGLGEHWEILGASCKPYPCAFVINPVVDACFDLLARKLPLERISGIKVEGHPLLRQRADRPNVTTGREAQISVQHTVAAVLAHGAAGVAQYEDASANDPVVLAMRGKVEIASVPGIDVGAARVTVTLAGGETWTSFIEDARGSVTRPLTDAEIEEKVRDLARYACPGYDPEPLIGAIWSLDEAADAAAVIELARNSTFPGGRH